MWLHNKRDAFILSQLPQSRVTRASLSLSPTVSHSLSLSPSLVVSQWIMQLKFNFLHTKNELNCRLALAPTDCHLIVTCHWIVASRAGTGGRQRVRGALKNGKLGNWDFNMSHAITATATTSEKQLANEPDKQLRSEQNDDHEPKRVSCGPWSAWVQQKKGRGQSRQAGRQGGRTQGGMEVCSMPQATVWVIIETAILDWQSHFLAGSA